MIAIRGWELEPAGTARGQRDCLRLRGVEGGRVDKPASGPAGGGDTEQSRGTGGGVAETSGLFHGGIGSKTSP